MTDSDQFHPEVILDDLRALFLEMLRNSPEDDREEHQIKFDVYLGELRYYVRRTDEVSK